MRRIDKVIIHCTATRPEWMKDRSSKERLAEIKRWHVEQNGWSDIGYHWLIDRDGTILRGRPEAKAGAHTRGENAHSIGIALFGGHGSSADDKFAEHFTPEQEKSLIELINNLQRWYVSFTLHGHNEFAAKACPGFRVMDWARGMK